MFASQTLTRSMRSSVKSTSSISMMARTRPYWNCSICFIYKMLLFLSRFLFILAGAIFRVVWPSGLASNSTNVPLLQFHLNRLFDSLSVNQKKKTSIVGNLQSALVSVSYRRASHNIGMFFFPKSIPEMLRSHTEVLIFFLQSPKYR